MCLSGPGSRTKSSLLFEGPAKRKPVASPSKMGCPQRARGVSEVGRGREDSVFLAAS